MRGQLNRIWQRNGGWWLSRFALGAGVCQAASGGCGDLSGREIFADFTSSILTAVVNEFITESIQTLFNAPGLTL